jgi:transposase InsO family protein
MRDRDPVYGSVFGGIARSIGLRQMVSAPRTPVVNPYAERVIGTLRREYTERPHQSLNGERPAPLMRLVGNGPVVARPHLGGLHHSYRRAA